MFVKSEILNEMLHELTNAIDNSSIINGKNENGDGIYRKVHKVEAIDNNRDRIDDILAHYERMKSPGKIVFHRNNIISYFLYTTDKLQMELHKSIDRDSKIELAHLLLSQIYAHEHFHLYCDINSYLIDKSSFRFDRLHEEALAVAFSHLELIQYKRVSKIKYNSLDSNVKRLYKNILFDFSNPGYKDWKKFKHQEDVTVK